MDSAIQNLPYTGQLARFFKYYPNHIERRCWAVFYKWKSLPPSHPYCGDRFALSQLLDQVLTPNLTVDRTVVSLEDSRGQ